MPENDTVETLPEYTVTGDKGDKSYIKTNYPSSGKLGGLTSGQWAKALATFGSVVQLVGGGLMALKGVDPAQVDLGALAEELFGIQRDLLNNILKAEGEEGELRKSYEALRSELDTQNLDEVLSRWEKFQPQMDRIAQRSRDSEVKAIHKTMSDSVNVYEDALKGTEAGQRYYGAQTALEAMLPGAVRDTERSSVSRGGDFDDSPAVREGEITQPGLIAQPDIPRTPGAPPGAQNVQVVEARIDPATGLPYDIKTRTDTGAYEGLLSTPASFSGSPDLGPSTFNVNPSQFPEAYAPTGGGGGGAGGGTGGGGAQGFGYAPFGNLGGRILPGLESAAMTQPFRPLLGSLNQQAMFPGVSPITQSLFQGALEELPLGGALTPGQQRDIEQQSFEIAERQGNLRSRPAAFAALLNTDQAKQIRQRERQTYAAGVNQMAQQEQERNRSLALNVEGLNQSTLGQDRDFGLGVGKLLGGLNLAGQELGQRGGIAGVELGQMAQRIEQDRINQARNFMLNSMSPFSQAAQLVNPAQSLNIQGTSGIGLGGNLQQQTMARPPATPVLFPRYAQEFLSPFGQRNLMNEQQAGQTSFSTLGDYVGGAGSMARNLMNSFFGPSSSWWGPSYNSAYQFDGGGQAGADLAAQNAVSTIGNRLI